MTESNKPKFFYGWFVVAAAFVILVIMWGTAYSFGIFFKPLLTEFHWTSATTAGAYSLLIFLHGFLSVVTGGLNDRYGPRVVMTACGCFLGLGYLLMSQISDVWQLYLFYGVMIGIGMSGGFVPLVSTISRWFVKGRGLMTGIVVSGIGLGTIIMPPLANQLISTYGWRTSYIIIGCAVLVLIVIAAQFLRYSPSQVGQLPYGETEAEEESSNLENGGFSLHQVVHTRQFWTLCAVVLCFGFGLQTVMVHIARHAIELEITAMAAASILAVIGGLSIAGRIIIGSAADRIGNRRALIISFILMSAALFWLQLAKEVGTFYLFAAVFGFAYGGVVVVESPMVAEMFGLSSHGIILGIISCGFAVGGAIGPYLAGYIFDITGSYQIAFLVCAIMGIMAIMLATLLRPIVNRGGTNE